MGSKNILRWIAEQAIDEHHALQKPAELAGFLAVLADLEPRPKIMVEIGCDAGGTLWAWKQMGIPRIIGIEQDDVPRGTANPWGTTNRLVDHGCEIIRGNTHDDSTRDELVAALNGEKIDVLFIDGDHSYEGVKQDYVMYAPLVSDDGLVAMHDVSPHPNHPGVGVQRFWQQVQGDKDEILVAPATWGGIGFVRLWKGEPAMLVNR